MPFVISKKEWVGLMNELSLFSGSGGGVLATSHLLNWRTVGYVEFNPYCQQVLAQRIKDELLDFAPIFGDVRAFIDQGYADVYKGMVGVVSAGFPCQPFSVAGRQKAEDDPRNMWPATLDVIRRVEPRYCLLENVPGLLSRKHRYFETILKDLAESGYNAKWKVISAAEVGAPHKRDRLFIVANRLSVGRQAGASEGIQSQIKFSEGQESQLVRKGISSSEVVADSDTGFSEGADKEIRTRRHAVKSSSQDLANTESQSSDGREDYARVSMERQEVSESGDSSGSSRMADTNVKGLEGYGSESRSVQERETEHSAWDQGETHQSKWWESEPDVGRVAHGVASRVDRLKALGNGQVPLVVARAWEILK